jgi:hypothetical protein
VPFLFIYMMLHYLSQNVELSIEGGRPWPWSKTVQFLQPEVGKVVLFDSLVNTLRFFKGLSECGIHYLFFDRGVDGEFLHDLVSQLGFLALARLLVLFEQ